MEPINYLPNPQDSFAQGFANVLKPFQMMQEVDKAKIANQQAQLQNQQAQQQQQVLNDLLQKQQAGTIGQKDYEQATIAIPGMREHFKQAWDMHSDEEKKSSLNEMTQVYSALSSDRPDLAKQVLNDRVEALKNSGAPQDRIQAVQTMINNIEVAPDFVRLNTGMMLGAIGAKEAFAGTEEQRKEQLQPGELKKQGAELGLTSAQTNKALVEAQKIGLENKKLILEMEAMKKGGTVDPQKQFEFEQKLRNEYNTQTGDFQTVRSSYQRVLQSQDTPAGDIALIFNYMKMLDPGSVVREGEFATAQNAGGIPDRILNAYNKALNGERLNPGQREMFANQAKSLYSGAQSREKEVRKGLERVVNNYGLNKSNVFYEEEGASTPAKIAGAGQQTSQAALVPGQSTMPSGWKVTVRK